MKKFMLLAVLAVALTGCDLRMESDYEMDATREQARAECIEFGGVANTLRLSYAVNESPWTVSCINATTGNVFKVYVKGVLK